MLQRLYIFIQYLGCLPLKSVAIVFKDETFPDTSGLPNFVSEYFLTFQIFQTSEQRQNQRQKNARDYWAKIFDKV